MFAYHCFSLSFVNPWQSLANIAIEVDNFYIGDPGQQLWPTTLHSRKLQVGTCHVLLLTTISAVNLKIPPFWPADPAIWFAKPSLVLGVFSTNQVRSYCCGSCPRVCSGSQGPDPHTSGYYTFWYSQKAADQQDCHFWTTSAQAAVPRWRTGRLKAHTIGQFQCDGRTIQTILWAIVFLKMGVSVWNIYF